MIKRTIQRISTIIKHIEVVKKDLNKKLEANEETL